MLKTVTLLAGVALVGCAADAPTAAVRVSMTPMGGQARTTGGAALTPSELSVKMTVVYVAEDVASGRGDNVGSTQAVYASPACDGILGADGTVQAQPDLGACAIDVGMMSSSSPPKLITSSPQYIDLAAGEAAVDAQLDAGRFGVAAGTYKYLRMDIGSNAPDGQFNGNQDISPAGTAMNFRFRVPGMAQPFEIRRLVGVDVMFPTPLVITGDETVDIDVQYSLADVVREIGPGGGAPSEPAACSTAVDGHQYCLDVSAIQFHPVLTVVPAGG